MNCLQQAFVRIQKITRRKYIPIGSTKASLSSMVIFIIHTCLKSENQEKSNSNRKRKAVCFFELALLAMTLE